MTPHGYWFKSSLFEIEPGEDDEINPGIYGRQLAAWLKPRLQAMGYTVDDVIAEDWGRCLVCRRDPFFLWVGCASVSDDESRDAAGSPPRKEHVTWHCFAAAEVFFWKRLFRKIDTGPAVDKLYQDLGIILRSEPHIALVEEP